MSDEKELQSGDVQIKHEHTNDRANYDSYQWYLKEYHGIKPSKDFPLKKYSASERSGRARCYDCGLDYNSSAWINAIVPDDVWEKINPSEYEGGGLLCISCINRRCDTLGLKDIPVQITSGALVNGRILTTEPIRMDSYENIINGASYILNTETDALEVYYYWKDADQKRMAEVLKWYADESNYIPGLHDDGKYRPQIFSNAALDNGERAREALERRMPKIIPNHIRMSEFMKWLDEEMTVDKLTLLANQENGELITPKRKNDLQVQFETLEKFYQKIVDVFGVR